MLRIKNVSARNFLSIGNITQAVNFDTSNLTLVLGNNLDLGGDGSRNGVGKAQPLYSKIKIPGGWTTMGNITVGDIVSTPDGQNAKVIGTFPQGSKPTYRVSFNDGRTVDACEDHLWKVYSHAFNHKSEDCYQVLSTKEIINHLEKYKNYKNKSSGYIYVPLLEDNSPDTDLPMDPYTFGLLLGDGSFSKSKRGFSSSDSELVEYVSNNLLENITLHQADHHKECDYSIKCIKQTNPSAYSVFLRNLNLYGKLSHEKFIPDQFKYAGTQQKIDLIAGLVDSDGHVSATGALSITTTSKKLAQDIREVVHSIGGIASIRSSTNRTYMYKGVRKKCKDAYTVCIRFRTPNQLSRLPRKKNLLPGKDYQYRNLKLKIDSIHYIGEVENKCIMIDHPDHLYITDNFVVTHNTAIINALSYALYGEALDSVKKDNLINHTNGKGMMVTVDFEIKGTPYRIERGRRPNVLRFYVNGIADEDNEGQGDSRETQKIIEDTVGFSHTMFKHIVALNTYSIPFLQLRTNEQRDMIEQLLGITEISSKAETLKELLRNTRDAVREEEIQINALEASNKRIESNIKDIQNRSRAWEKQRKATVIQLEAAITQLEEIDVDQELDLHSQLTHVIEIERSHQALKNEHSQLSTSLQRSKKNVEQLRDQLKSLKEGVCHACGQDTHHLETHAENISRLERDLTEEEKYYSGLCESLTAAEAKIAELGEIPPRPKTFYNNVSDAHAHKHNLQNLVEQLANKTEEENPYISQIEGLQKTGLVPISFDRINDLNYLREHQEFLYKLLTSKDSFIRKKIIDQNIAYLNHRLAYYLESIGLPHEVRFLSDLSVEIQDLGRNLDFAQLSRGERNRLILSLSWAFRDIYESLNHPINLLCIDELVDNGLDSTGVEMALAILKRMSRDHNRSVFLISHREELIGRVNTVLMVEKSGGFTSYSTDTEYQE
jgi:DNA repair exonuclease SbcCD ATPase subunit